LLDFAAGSVSTTTESRAVIDSVTTWLGVLGLEIILVRLPYVTTDFPPMSDLINHMARLYIIADGGGDQALAQMYHPVWHVIPNLAIDLIGPNLIELTSVSIAARLGEERNISIVLLLYRSF
jgi:hypothetical protein